MSDKPLNYEVVYSKKWQEWQVRNDHGRLKPTESWDAEYMYGFSTLGEAVDCAKQLREWHNNSRHPSYRKPKEWWKSEAHTRWKEANLRYEEEEKEVSDE
jgi:hypothetical protein